MTPLRIIIKAVPDRSECIKYLRRHLPAAEWCFDRRRSALDTFLRGLEMAGDDPVVLMEEDVLLTVGFLDKLHAAVAERPQDLIQFFSMRSLDLTSGSRWDRAFMMNQCHYQPAGTCTEMLAFAKTWDGWAANPHGYDTMMQAWMRATKRRYWIHVPSLVDHRVGKSMLDKRRSSRRQSLTFRDPLP